MKVVASAAQLSAQGSVLCAGTMALIVNPIMAYLAMLAKGQEVQESTGTVQHQLPAGQTVQLQPQPAAGQAKGSLV